jgi:hypothetical protein
MPSEFRDKEAERRHATFAIPIALACIAGCVAVLVLLGLSVSSALRVFGFAGVGLLVVGWIALRPLNKRASTGLCVGEFTCDYSVRDTAERFVGAFPNVRERAFDPKPSTMLVAVRTARSALSYGEWIVAEISGEGLHSSVVVASWNVEPTVTFGMPRRNVRRAARALRATPSLLTKAEARSRLQQWQDLGLLVPDSTGNTLQPSWRRT